MKERQRETTIVKVILADNQSVFRTGTARILAVEEDFRIVGQCDDLPRLHKAVGVFPNAIVVAAASLRPDFGDLVRATRAGGGSVIAIVENDESPKDYIREGVRGILYRDTTNAELLRCFRAVARGELHVQKRISDTGEGFESDVVAERVRERLTPKELMIVRLLLQGYKNRDIAEELHNSEQVIKNYLRSIFDKTGVSGRLELALFAMHHKLLGDVVGQVQQSRDSETRMSTVN